jgi:hypothetical protein
LTLQSNNLENNTFQQIFKPKSNFIFSFTPLNLLNLNVMKRFPQIDRFFTAVCSFAILALFILLSSCEKESLQDDFSRIKASNINTASLKTMLSYDDCASTCIEEGIETYYAKNYSKSGSSGQNAKAVGYNAYNTETQFIVEVAYLITDGSSNAKATITIDIDGDEVEIEEVASGSTVSHAIDLPDGWQACDVVSFSILQEALGQPIDFNESYSLVGVCTSGCEESFGYSANEDGSYTFTYVSSEDLENAEIKFTCPHITDFEAMDGKEYEVNPGNSHGSPTVLTWTGEVEACTEITFTLSFEADCEQNNSGNANMFTDFKVNGVSKKGDNENIVFTCSE